MKRFLSLLLVAVMLFTLPAGCEKAETPEYTKYSTQFFGAFDTIIQLVAYADSEESFKEQADYTQARFVELSHLFDRFYEYEGINNICTINKNAGNGKPIPVDPLIIELVEKCREWSTKTDGQINIAMGSVLEVWHSYMEMYSAQDGTSAQPIGKIPSTEELQDAVAHISMDDVLVDKEAGTIRLAEPDMLLDLGAAAKGFSAQIISKELAERGLSSHLLSAGGNVIAAEAPLDGVRDSWGVGFQDPFADPNDPNSDSLDVAFLCNLSAVTSGDYQRYYLTTDGRRMHHIIDPDTLMPADYYRGLTVVTEDSGMADIFSTALFCMDYETGRSFAEKHGLKVMWVFPDGRVECTNDLVPLLKTRGNATAAIDKGTK